jgi:hypothetical protein
MVNPDANHHLCNLNQFMFRIVMRRISVRRMRFFCLCPVIVQDWRIEVRILWKRQTQIAAIEMQDQIVFQEFVERGVNPRFSSKDSGYIFKSSRFRAIFIQRNRLIGVLETRLILSERDGAIVALTMATSPRRLAAAHRAMQCPPGAGCTLIAERAGQGGLTVERMCEVSGISRARFYRQWQSSEIELVCRAIQKTLGTSGHVQRSRTGVISAPLAPMVHSL